jgi:hypothetical protein
VTPAGEKLQSHLDQAIADLTAPQEGPTMRGMNRLANLTETLQKSIDAKADAVADRIEKAHARGEAAIGKFEAYAVEVEKTADAIEASLGQISNLPPSSEEGGGSEPSSGT